MSEKPQSYPPENEAVDMALAETEVSPDICPSDEEVAVLAYSYWEARGFQGGTPEEDWFRAVEELRSGQPDPKD
jgi:hypothetical protein